MHEGVLQESAPSPLTHREPISQAAEQRSRQDRESSAPSQLRIYTSYMSPMQASAYKKASGNSASNFYAKERQCSNFVFPDGSWGNGYSNDNPGGGFQKYIIQQGDSFFPSVDLFPWLTSIGTIKTLSCKYARIIETILNNPGNVFIYGEYVVGSGNIALALCLEGLGWQRYNESTSVFVDAQNFGVKPLCSGGYQETMSRTIRSDFKTVSAGGAPKYGILTIKTSGAKFQSMIEAMNSYENRHGDIIIKSGRTRRHKCQQCSPNSPDWI